MILKSEEEAKEYFRRAAQTCTPGAIILFHNQRKTVLSVLKNAAEKAGKRFIEQDLSVLPEGRIGSNRFENKLPEWLGPVMEASTKGGSLLYMREFHFSGPVVKTDAMNLILKREVEGVKLPDNTLIVLGLLDTDDEAAGLSGTHTATFYRTV